MHFEYGMAYDQVQIEELNEVDLAPESSHHADDLFVEQLPDKLDVNKIEMGLHMSLDEKVN